MKVILSVDSVKFPLTGIARYTYELAKQLQAQPDLDLTLLANGRAVAELPAHRQINPRKTDWLKSQLRKSDLVTKTYQMLSGIRNQISLKDHEDAIFHGPNFYLPIFNGYSVATFHDLSIFTHAQYHTPARVRFMQRELSLTLQRASLLITDSEYTRQELANYFGYPLDKIHAIPLACSAEFHPRKATSTALTLDRFGLRHGGYVLYTGTIEPRKNIETLLDAYSILPDAIRRRWPLVLAGYHGWKSESLHARIKAAASAGWVHYLGYVADDDLPYLFAGAHLFIFPSHYEGFGLPVLEALASGVPVICSNASSLPEVAGGAALLFDPDDVSKLSELIITGLEDESWRGPAINKGLEQASTFSWQKCAEETIAVYQELAGDNVFI
ncbi:glycosyltransferase family 4 protein [methanotrophic endosymbiont of Bathymodiolus puteoserpentis (Logatchev)]|uniref:glycosyltransferase family 4 protein n=1 Tax=methanotrophic endosymbiont of Bathymodiolus puteoserpentis (Logatchev) TaxID=343235 RepID=UPI0013C8CBB8|nr:glycosyltransferase family 1 protein [methanotrophic endosymbiont of Bathymodiolus puteoserpentis (Logatchev)]SHE23498.1 glycosyl transferase, group 1 family protein [methanotrophic endosymbiont of Bathymodiolus puteoserpentis (Logatchev)]